MKTIDPHDKVFLDTLSVLTAGATVMNYLPAVAAVFTIVWTGIRIYETDTVQKLLGKHKEPNDG